nr:GNAT family N-acetyltransferase [uncultured Rhodoferax sp.]
MSDTLTWQWLPFDALSREQLYELLRLRSEVFVVEQNCIFQDMDGLDDQAMHLLGVRASADSAPCPPPALRAPPLPTQNPLPPELPGALAGKGAQELVAYVRCFPAGVTFDEASIGRVVTRQSARGGGLGHVLMAEAIRALQQQWGVQPIRIGAQAHLKNFYERHGFADVGKAYVEDGIDHLEMVRQPV